jgi:hypothetical protein
VKRERAKRAKERGETYDLDDEDEDDSDYDDDDAPIREDDDEDKPWIIKEETSYCGKPGCACTEGFNRCF